MTVKFVYPWVLYFFWFIPVVYIWWFALNKHSRDRLKKFASVVMLKKLLPQTTSRRFYLQSTFVCAGLLLSLVALARPQWGVKEQVFHQRGRDIMICLDVSRSMLATDVRPNRLERAKSDLLDLIYSLKGDRAGLIAFRNGATFICPLTSDYSYLRQALLHISPSSAPRGETDLGAAIEKALASFDDDDSSHKAIMFVSDGEDLSGKALQAAERAKEKGIPIFTVGFGSRRGSTLPDRDDPNLVMQYDGKDVVSKLEHETLYKIANISGGSYIPIETASLTKTTLGDLYRDNLRGITAEDREETIKRTHIERFQYFLFPALICFIFATIFARGRLYKNRDLKMSDLKQISILVIFSLCSTYLSAQHATPVAPDKPFTYETNSSPSEVILGDEVLGRSRFIAREAQKFYGSGNYTKASDYYERASTASTSLSERDFYRYNAAVSAYKAGDFTKASLLFSAVNQDSGVIDKTRLFDSAGASYYRESDIGTNRSSSAYTQRLNTMRQAGQAFQNSLRNKPDDLDAAQNFAFVFNKLPEVGQEAKFTKLMEETEEVSLDDLVDKIWSEQKSITEKLGIALTNKNYTIIDDLESIAKRQDSNSDLVIPLKVKVNQAVSQQQQMTEQTKLGFQILNQLLDSSQEKMSEAASKMKDLNLDAWRTAKIAESGMYNIWKDVAPFPKVLGEAIHLQTNNIEKTVANLDNNPLLTKEVLSVQTEIGGLTELFEFKFTNSIPIEGTQQQISQQGFPATPQTAEAAALSSQEITSETRAEVVTLLQQAKDIQINTKKQMQNNSYSEALLGERESYRILKEIEELLPKQQSQDQQKQDENQDPQDQNQDQQDQNQDDKENNQDQQDQQNSEEQPEASEEKEDEQDTQPEEKQQELSDDQVRQMLQKALQREAEHREEKMKFNESAPLSPYERDW